MLEAKRPTSGVGKQKKRKKKGDERKKKKRSEPLSLTRVPVEVLVQIFAALEDHFALWSLRSTCKCFNNVISSFPVLGTQQLLRILIDNLKFIAIYSQFSEWRAFKAKLVHDVAGNRKLESKLEDLELIEKAFLDLPPNHKKSDSDEVRVHCITQNQHNRR